MRFVAVDVETANEDLASICSIGLAVYDDGRLVSELYTLIDPEDDFSGINISIHGIEPSMVEGAPTWRDIAPDVCSRLAEGKVGISHGHFDRVALRQAGMRWGVPTPGCTWLDTMMVARRTWADCARSGYGLTNLCKRIGYTFEHHHALEDAKAAGQILIAASLETGLDLDAWLQRVRQPIDLRKTEITRTGNPEGPVAGEQMVFTGALTILRSEAADLAARLGYDVSDSVTRRTTLLVVGDQDVARLAGHKKSSKHRKAEELIAKGQSLRILRETDFRGLVALS